jgi:methylated-DNA-[protein]-cysteine S-methyltransferase
MTKIDIAKLKGTDFQIKVWSALLDIPKGETITYKGLARQINKPKAVRAVANAVGMNPCAPTIPCHRVVRSDGKLGGYSGVGGVKKKLALLTTEGVKIYNNKLTSINSKLYLYPSIKSILRVKRSTI